MKKVIALALTLAMVLALGVTAFAAASMNIDAKTTYEVGKTYNLPINVLSGEKVTKVYDTSNLIKFETPVAIDGNSTLWTVLATMNAKGYTKIVVEYTDTNEDAQKYESAVFEIKDAADTPQAGEDYLGLAEYQAMLDAWMVKPTSVIALDLVKTSDDLNTAENEYKEYDGITAELYNAVAKLNPEVIELYTDVYSIRLYRGDYTKLTVKSNVEINTMITVSDVLELKKKDANNRVLTALGNNNADPFYVTIDTTNLTEIAANPELSVVLDTDEFAAWCKTNNCKAMDIYTFDPEDDTVALVKENVSVNNLFDNVVEMPTLESAIYVFVDADNSATGSANVKPNTNTGANDMVAVAVVFATIALAAGVSKKVR